MERCWDERSRSWKEKEYPLHIDRPQRALLSGKIKLSPEMEWGIQSSLLEHVDARYQKTSKAVSPQQLRGLHKPLPANRPKGGHREDLQTRQAAGWIQAAFEGWTQPAVSRERKISLHPKSKNETFCSAAKPQGGRGQLQRFCPGGGKGSAEC